MSYSKEENTDALFENIDKARYFDRMIEEYRSLMQLFDSMIMNARQSPGVPNDCIRVRKLTDFIDRHLLSFIKFYDHLRADDHRENYYMEREWRVIDHVQFDLPDIKTVFMPKEYSKSFRENCPSYESHLEFI